MASGDECYDHCSMESAARPDLSLDSAEVTTPYFSILTTIRGGLLKPVRSLAVIFQRPMLLLPWTRQFARSRFREEI